jgi:hypothetical protein
MTQTQPNDEAGIFDGLSPKEVAEKINSEGGQEGLVFATMVIAMRAMAATKGVDDDLGCDIAKNLHSFLKSSAVENFLGSFIKRCAKDEFREPFEESPLMAMVIMAKATHEEKKKYANVLTNLCMAALDLDKKTS